MLNQAGAAVCGLEVTKKAAITSKEKKSVGREQAEQMQESRFLVALQHPAPKSWPSGLAVLGVLSLGFCAIPPHKFLELPWGKYCSL